MTMIIDDILFSYKLGANILESTVKSMTYKSVLIEWE